MNWELPGRVYASTMAPGGLSRRSAESVNQPRSKVILASAGDDQQRAAFIAELRAKRGLYPSQDLTRFQGPESGTRVDVGGKQ